MIVRTCRSADRTICEYVLERRVAKQADLMKRGRMWKVVIIDGRMEMKKIGCAPQ